VTRPPSFIDLTLTEVAIISDISDAVLPSALDSLKWSLEHGCKLTILFNSCSVNQEKFKQASEKVGMPFFIFQDLERSLAFCKNYQ